MGVDTTPNTNDSPNPPSHQNHAHSVIRLLICSFLKKTLNPRLETTGKPDPRAAPMHWYGSAGYLPAGHDFGDIVDNITSRLEHASIPGRNFSAKPWAIGSFGAHGANGTARYGSSVSAPTTKQQVLPSARAGFMQAWQDALTKGRWPRLKMLVHFDLESTSITKDLLPHFIRLLQSPFFTANDRTGADTTLPFVSSPPTDGADWPQPLGHFKSISNTSQIQSISTATTPGAALSAPACKMDSPTTMAFPMALWNHPDKMLNHSQRVADDGNLISGEAWDRLVSTMQATLLKEQHALSSVWGKLTLPSMQEVTVSSHQQLRLLLESCQLKETIIRLRSGAHYHLDGGGPLHFRGARRWVLVSDGRGAVLDGVDHSRVIELFDGASVALHHISVVRGRATQRLPRARDLQGGCIAVLGHSTLELVQSSIQGCISEVGGAVYLERGQLRLVSSKMDNAAAYHDCSAEQAASLASKGTASGGRVCA